MKLLVLGCEDANKREPFLDLVASHFGVGLQKQLESRIGSYCRRTAVRASEGMVSWAGSAFAPRKPWPLALFGACGLCEDSFTAREGGRPPSARTDARQLG